MKKKIGKIDISGLDAPPLKHEFETAKFLVKQLGKDIEFLAPNRRKGSKTPDISMDGINWEIKCLKSDGKYTVQHAFKTTAKQSQYMIFDVRKSKANSEKTISKINKEFSSSKVVKRVMIITKMREILDFQK
jgi:hypothetical protein